MKSRIKLGALCLVVLVMGLVITRAIELQTANAAGQAVDRGGESTTRRAVPNLANFVYLPYITRACGGICGRVTNNGAAAAGVPLSLRFYNGSSWSTLATTNTASNGFYVFLGVPSLGAGQRYYVRYLNTTNPGSLYLWQAHQLTSYTAGNSVTIGDFDIFNIQLFLPSPSSTVTLPNTFSWFARPATPSDSYEFNLFHPSGSPYWWTPHLGYVGAYSLISLPPNFNPLTWYLWYVAVYSPDGGYGESFNSRYVWFLNTGSPDPGGSRESQPPKEFLENDRLRSRPDR